MTQPFSKEKQEIFGRFAAHVSSGKAAFFRDHQIPFVFGHREGPYVWDVDGDKSLINCHCNGGVYNLGHRHPEVVAALTRALETVDIGCRVAQTMLELSSTPSVFQNEGLAKALQFHSARQDFTVVELLNRFLIFFSFIQINNLHLACYSILC